MRLLLDTNISLEVILEQERAGEAQSLLSAIEEHEFFLSDYFLHSIGLLFFRRRQHEVFRQFLIDMFLEAGVAIIALSAWEMDGVIQGVRGQTFDLGVLRANDWERMQSNEKTPRSKV